MPHHPGAITPILAIFLFFPSSIEASVDITIQASSCFYSFYLIYMPPHLILTLTPAFIFTPKDALGASLFPRTLFFISCSRCCWINHWIVLLLSSVLPLKHHTVGRLYFFIFLYLIPTNQFKGIIFSSNAPSF